MKLEQLRTSRWGTSLGFAVLFLSAGIMTYYDAPGWSYVLLVYLGLQPSRLDMANDIAAVQSTVRRVRQDVNDEAGKADKFREEVRKSRRPQ